MIRTLFILGFTFLNLVILGQSVNNDTTHKFNNTLIEVDKYADYPGGEIALKCFLSKNIKQDIVSNDYLTEGRVFVTFKIDTLGRISKVRIIRHYNRKVDNEIKRVIKSMPNWIPAEVLIGYPHGTWVKRSVDYNLPIKIPFKNQCP